MTAVVRHRAAPPLAVLALVLLALGAPAGAQTFGGEVDVRLVDLAVEVRDAQGLPVMGLTAADFELRIDGEPAAIEYFSAPERPAAVPTTAAEAPPPTTGDDAPALSVLLTIDRAFLRPGEAAAVVPAVERFLAALPPGTRAGLVTLDRGLEVVVEPAPATPAMAGALAAAVADAAARPGRGQALESEYRDVLATIDRIASQDTEVSGRSAEQTVRILASRIQAFAAEARQAVAESGRQLRQVVRAAAGLPGRPVVVYVGGRMPLDAGPTLGNAWESTFLRGAWAYQQTPASPGGGQGPVGAGGASGTTGGGLAFDGAAVRNLPTAADVLAEVADDAAVRGVAFYALDVGYLREAAATTLGRGEATMASRSGVVRWDYDTTQGASSRAAFAEIADRSGGRYLAARGSLDAELGALPGELATAYFLGFTPPADDDQHRIEVRVAGERGWTVRHRERFARRAADTDAGERLVSALALGGVVDPALPLEVELGTPEGRRLPVVVRVPAAAIALVPEPWAHAGQLSLFVATGADGTAGEVRKSVLPVRLGNDEILDAVRRQVEHRLEVELPRGAEAVAIAVRDDYAETLSTARRRLESP